MKTQKPVVALLLMILLNSCAGQRVELTTRVHEFQSPKNQSQLFVAANNWMVEQFMDARSVIQFTDKEEGVVTGRYLLHDITNSMSLDSRTREIGIFAVIKIQVKDGASRISITPEPFQEFKSPTDHIYGKARSYGKQEAETQIAELIASYEEYVNNDTSGNW